MSLTNDAEKMICHMYKAYLERRKDSMDKLNAKHFSFEEIKELKPFAKWSDRDIRDTVAEVSRAGYGNMYLDGGFSANDDFIVFMENRFKNGLSEVIDFITKLI